MRSEELTQNPPGAKGDVSHMQGAACRTASCKGSCGRSKNLVAAMLGVRGIKALLSAKSQMPPQSGLLDHNPP